MLGMRGRKVPCVRSHGDRPGCRSRVYGWKPHVGITARSPPSAQNVLEKRLPLLRGVGGSDPKKSRGRALPASAFSTGGSAACPCPALQVGWEQRTLRKKQAMYSRYSFCVVQGEKKPL